MPDMAVHVAFIGKNDVSDDITRMRGDMRRFGDTSRSIFKRMKSDALSMRSVMGGVLGARAVTAGIGVIRNQVRTITDELIQFDHAAVKASARYGFDRFSEEFKRIGEAARDTGATTRFTAAESAMAIDQFAMAGFRLRDSMALVKPTAKLAMAADLEIAKSAEIAATALAKFNEPVENFGKVGDILAFTANSTKTNLGEMFETIRSGGGVISTVGSDVETFSALARAMGDMKMVGEQAGTSMKTGFLRALVGGKGGKKARKALGLDKFVKDERGNFRDLIEIIEFMEGKFAKMTEADRTRSMRQIFGLNSIEGMSAIFRAGSAKLSQYRDEARAATGYVDGLADKMGQSYENKIKEIQSALVEAGFKIVEQYGDEIPGALEKVIDTVRGIDFKAIHGYMAEGLALGKKAYETIKAAIPYLKTAAIIWAGFRITSGIQTAAGTFSHMAQSVALLGQRQTPVISNFGRMDAALRGVNSNSVKGLNNSLDVASSKAMGVVNTIGLIGTTAVASYQLADTLFGYKDRAVKAEQETAAFRNKKYTMDQIAGTSDLDELSRIEKDLRHAVGSARTGQAWSRENVSDAIGAFFAGGESNFAKYEKTESELMEKLEAARSRFKGLATEKLNRAKVDYENEQYTKGDIAAFKKEAEQIRQGEIKLKQKLEVESVVRFEGNVPEGTTAESKVKAPPINKEALGVN